MAQFAEDGTRIATTLFEAAAWRQSIHVTCGRCSRTETFNAHGLWWLFEKKGWDQRLTAIPDRLACKVCRRRYRNRVPQPRIKLVGEARSDRYLPLPSDSEWKKAISRFRS